MDEPQKPEVKGGGNPPAATRTLPPTLTGMTRKTKVGLAVGASFLTLVGGVFGIKQFGKPAAEPAKEAAAVVQNTSPAAPPAPAAGPGNQDKPATGFDDPFNPPAKTRNEFAGLDPAPVKPVDQPSVAANGAQRGRPSDPFATESILDDPLAPLPRNGRPAPGAGGTQADGRVPEPQLGTNNEPRGGVRPAAHKELRPQDKDAAREVTIQLPPIDPAPGNSPQAAPMPDPVAPAPDRQRPQIGTTPDPMKDPGRLNADPVKDPAGRDAKAAAAAPHPVDPAPISISLPPIDAVPATPVDPAAPAPVKNSGPGQLALPSLDAPGGQNPKGEGTDGRPKPRADKETTRPVLSLNPAKKKEDTSTGALQPVSGSDPAPLAPPPPAPVKKDGDADRLGGPEGKKNELQPKLDPVQVGGPEPKKEERIPKLDLPLDPVPQPAPPMPMPREQTQPRPDRVPMTPTVPTIDLGPIKTPEPKLEPRVDGVPKPADLRPLDKADNPPKPVDLRPADRADGGPKPADKSEGNASSGRPLPPAAVAQDGGYDEDLHRSSANDNFRTISRRYYEDEGYAAALEQYNRDNPGGAGYVRVPPIEVLLKRYPKAMPKEGSRAPSPSGVAPASLSLQGDAAPAAPVRDYPVYTVPDNGETLRDIAQKTLGDANAWRYIQDLNGTLNPAEKVPGGTKLRLPPQARVQQ